ncbi:MAG: hypothetical protein M3P91_07355 [Actinomycetota bacterium]|nr:hypothetical protein [Actinomycetota bacterium]
MTTPSEPDPGGAPGSGAAALGAGSDVSVDPETVQAVRSGQQDRERPATLDPDNFVDAPEEMGGTAGAGGAG